MERSSSSGLLRKRPLNQAGSFNNLQHSHSCHGFCQQPLEDEYPPTTPSKSLVREHSLKQLHRAPLHALLPTLRNEKDESNDHSFHANQLNYSYHSLSSMRSRFRGDSIGIGTPKGSPRSNTSLSAVIPNAIRSQIEHLVAKVRLWNDTARQNSAHYDFIYNKFQPHLYKCYKFLRAIFFHLLSIKCTCRQTLLLLFIITIMSSSYVYFVKLPVWEYEEEWARWEEGMQKSVADLIPPLPSDEEITQFNKYWSDNSNMLNQFPYLKQKTNNDQDDSEPISEYVVPIPDYDLMGRTRGELAQKLKRHAIQSCEQSKGYHLDEQHPLPVIGITVANDTPENRYLRRLLYTIDLETVGSIVITWYDERTEAQLAGKEEVGLSRTIVEQTLDEFIDRKGYQKIEWDDATKSKDTNAGSSSHNLHLMSRMTTSIQQFCIYPYNERKSRDESNLISTTCVNELLVLQFPTNLGFSSGVNNALFTHPTAPHWLIPNYDIAYPAGVLETMAEELHRTKMQKPALAVHTYGYIYGKGAIENPWSNFIMTSCAVAKIGIWDENIFPAYFEDDDYRDRIRYVMGKWVDEVGDPDRYGNAPQLLMDDTHLIRYQTGRNVSVAHGPLTAETYLSGTSETMKKVEDEEKVEGVVETIWQWFKAQMGSKPPQNPYHYESQRWSIVKEISNGEGFFRCKHGNLPQAGEHGEDPIRYFGWYERFLQPFVNETRVTRMRRTSNNATNKKARFDNEDWSLWRFNATRRECVHKASNIILAMPPSEERTNLVEEFKALCSVC